MRIPRTHSGWTGLVCALAAIGLAASAQAVQLSDAQVFIEINDTAGDAGLQVKLDAEGWDRMQLLDPDGEVVFDIKAAGGVGLQGITELVFESAEPSFDEQPLAEFLALFPQGEYRFRGRTTEGVALRGKALLTHSLPGPPVLVRPLDGDDEVDPEDTVVEWALVADPPGSEIIGYQVIVETEEPRLQIFQADVGPTTREITVPAEFMRPGTEYVYEVLAIEESGNSTISEAEFETEGD